MPLYVCLLLNIFLIKFHIKNCDHQRAIHFVLQMAISRFVAEIITGYIEGLQYSECPELKTLFQDTNSFQ